MPLKLKKVRLESRNDDAENINPSENYLQSTILDLISKGIDLSSKKDGEKTKKKKTRT